MSSVSILGGLVEIRDPRLFRPGREAFCRELARSAVENLQARRVDIDLTSSICRLEFDPGEFDRAELASRAAAAVTAATPALNEPPRGPARNATPLVDLALAGGSLTLAVAGAVLPGIPSLPFLVLAAARSAAVARVRRVSQASIVGVRAPQPRRALGKPASARRVVPGESPPDHRRRRADLALDAPAATSNDRARNRGDGLRLFPRSDGRAERAGSCPGSRRLDLDES